jgi:hypothetical protein
LRTRALNALAKGEIDMYIGGGALLLILLIVILIWLF